MHLDYWNKMLTSMALKGEMVNLEGSLIMHFTVPTKQTIALFSETKDFTYEFHLK